MFHLSSALPHLQANRPTPRGAARIVNIGMLGTAGGLRPSVLLSVFDLNGCVFSLSRPLVNRMSLSFFSQDSLRVLCEHLPDSVLQTWWPLQRLASVLQPLPTEVSARYPERCCQTREAQGNTRFCLTIMFVCVIAFKNSMLVFLFYIIFILQFCHTKFETFRQSFYYSDAQFRGTCPLYESFHVMLHCMCRS